MNEGRENLAICISGMGVTSGFSALLVDTIPDIQLQFNGQCFPLHVFETTM